MIFTVVSDCVFITTSDAGCDDFSCTESWTGGVCSGKCTKNIVKFQ